MPGSDVQAYSLTPSWQGCMVSKTQEWLGHSFVGLATTLLPNLSLGLGWAVTYDWAFPGFFFHKL